MIKIHGKLSWPTNCILFMTILSKYTLKICLSWRFWIQANSIILFSFWLISFSKREVIMSFMKIRYRTSSFTRLFPSLWFYFLTRNLPTVFKVSKWNKKIGFQYFYASKTEFIFLFLFNLLWILIPLLSFQKFSHNFI